MRFSSRTSHSLISLGSFAFLLLTLFVPAFGQEGGSLSGKVVDQNGATVVGAMVKARNVGSGREVTVNTDEAGEYEFVELQPGLYRVSVESEGFATAAETLTVENPTATTRDFTLVPGALQDTVTVTAGKGTARLAIETPQTVTVATQEDLELRRPRSTFEAMERAPNLIVRETNPARERPRLRGLDSSRVLIVIDGERLNNARTDLQTGLSPSIIDVTELQSIEVVSGAGSSLYGSDSLAGTINLVTKAPERPATGENLSLRFDGTYYTNGDNRRGGVTGNFSNQMFALRAHGSLFRNANYNIGDDPLTTEEVIGIGNFYTRFPSNTAAQYPIFAVPAGGEILNGAGHGANGQLDLWFFPVERHSFRARFLDSSHSDLGDAFSGPPYETQERFNAFRKFRKYGFRYEGLELSRFIPRVSLNYYGQKLVFPQSQYDYSLVAGSSFVDPPGPPPPVFTGNLTRFTIGTFTDNQNSITTEGVDAQITLAPFTGMLVTTGYQHLIDKSRDQFTRFSLLNPNTREPNLATLLRGASTPDTDYTDNAFFVQAELDRFRFLRLSGGFRVDRWSTNAGVTNGFPLGSEFAVLNAAIPPLTADPGPLAPQVESLPALLGLVGRQGTVRTENNSVTGNVGVVARLPYGINPYFRYANSYREPSVSERYIIRNFPAFPGFVAIVVGNPNLEPETGRNIDVGVKVQQQRFNFSAGYFRNKLDNLIIFQTPLFGNICVTPAPPALPASFIPVGNCPAGRSIISFNGRVNQARNTIYGFEATGEYSLGLGEAGSLTPFATLGTLHGTNESPTTQQLSIISTLYNRDDTPVRLEGSADDVPLGNITPFRGIFGALYTDRRGRFFAEYQVRHQARVTRANPSSFLGPTLVNFGTFANLNSFTKHTVRGGYTLRRERYRMNFTAGVDNLTDRLFWEHFQTSPAPGRSFVFGVTTELFNLLNR